MAKTNLSIRSMAVAICANRFTACFWICAIWAGSNSELTSYLSSNEGIDTTLQERNERSKASSRVQFTQKSSNESACN
jgi:hypothetical protein